MDSVRFFLAIVLMVAVVVVTNLLFPPSRPRRAPGAPDTARATSPAGGRAPAAVPVPQAAAAGAGGAPAAARAPAQGTQAVLSAAPVVVVEAPLYRYGVSTSGGAITSAELLNYQSFTRRGPVQLAARELGPLVGYRVRLGNNLVDLRSLAFRAEPAEGLTLRPGSGAQTLRLVHDDAALHAEIDYTFEPDQYLVRVSGRVTAPGVDELVLDLPSTLAVNEASANEDYRALDYAVNSQREGISSVPLDKVKDERIEEGPLDWVAVKNKYFIVAAVVDTGAQATPFGGLVARDSRTPHAADLTATLPIGKDGTWRYRLYLGPQENQRLAAVGHQLQDVNPYGWRFLRPILRPIAHLVIWAVAGMHDILHLGYGWVLILFGVLVRIVLWPLNARAMRSQMRNMELQPRLKEIQDRLKNDPQKMQQEVMRLYREEGFNPLGGCLPMLIPMPVLIALFFVFQGAIEFRGVGFLWLPDLSRADPLYILPLLLGATMFALQWLGMRSTPSPNPQMKMMTYIMPVVWVFLFLNFASGLNLYYVAQNIASLPQQLQLLAERKRWQARRAPATP